MGQKANPNSLRYGVNKDWQSRWIAEDKKQFAKWLVQDHKIRELLIKKYKDAQISNVEIERQQTNIELFIYSYQPGFLFGKEGANLEKIKKEISLIVGKKIKVNTKIITIENAQLSARLVAREIADAIEKKVSFRNAQKMSIKKVLAAGALGVKTKVSGRLGGVEMARVEGYSEGVIPLSTIRADIDYSLEEAHTTYGLIGVKVWINRGEIFGNKLVNENPILIKSKRSSFDPKKQNKKSPREA
ncbi:MAG: 30S ribosomal protein S3 [Mycoplasmoidaceae bacterium]